MSKEIKISKSSVGNEPLLTLKEVAKYLNISYDTVNDMAAQNKIPYVIVGARKRFFKRHLDNWLESKIIPAKKGA